MRKLAVLGALVALSSLASVGPTFAQDEGGGASDSSAASTPNTPAPAAAPDTPAAAPAAPSPDDAVMDDAAALAAGCPTGSTKAACVALTNSDPFATMPWKSTSMDTPPAPRVPATGGAPVDPSQVEPDIVGPIR